MCAICASMGFEIEDCAECGAEQVPVWLDGPGCTACNPGFCVDCKSSDDVVADPSGEYDWLCSGCGGAWA